MKRYIKSSDTGITYEIDVCVVVGAACDEDDVISTCKTVEDIGPTSKNLNELKQYLQKHQMSKQSTSKSKSNFVVNEVATIAYEDETIGLVAVAYQTYGGQIVDIDTSYLYE
jgi:hypothetical protein